MDADGRWKTIWASHRESIRRDETLHPDIVVRQLDEAAARLSGLEPDDRVRLAAAIAARADGFQAPYRQFVEDVPEVFGLVDEDD
jgi:hypothetical protein